MRIFLCLCLVAKKVQENLTMFLKFSFLPLKFEKVIFFFQFKNDNVTFLNLLSLFYYSCQRQLCQLCTMCAT